jgi:Domain of unknown function (DUF4439)
MSAPTVTPPAVVSALQAALAGEHRAVFGYGALGPELAGADAQLAFYAERAHRNQRDRTSAQLRTLAVTPAPSAISYAVPTLTGAAAARRFARRLEDDAAADWRYVIVTATATAPTDVIRPVRDAALAALTASSVRALRWAETIDPARPTVAFPGI